MTRNAAPKAKPEKRKNGRPTIRTPEIVEEVIRRVSEGELLVDVLRAEGMPGKTTWGDWCRGDEALADRFARARDDGEDAMAAGIRQIARGGAGSSGEVARDKLIVDTELKLLAKFNPKRWGDRTTLAGDPEAPLQFTAVERRIVRPGD